jgi:cytoskeletal protein CcmA (bactofilin family)
MASSFDSSTLENTVTRLGKSANLSGTLRFTSSMRVDGHVSGTIYADGFLYIGEGSQVEAEIYGTNIVVAGTVRGNIHASEKVELLETARMHGNIKAAKIRILDGVILEGRCEMIERSDSIDIFALPLQDLKQSMNQTNKI